MQRFCLLSRRAASIPSQPPSLRCSQETKLNLPKLEERYTKIRLAYDYLQEGMEVASWSNQNSRSSSLKQALEADWQQKNRVVVESASPSNLEKVGSKEPPPCHQRGLCARTKEGKQHWALRTDFLQASSRGQTPPKEHGCWRVRLCVCLQGTKGEPPIDDLLGVAYGEFWSLLCWGGLWGRFPKKQPQRQLYGGVA